MKNKMKGFFLRKKILIIVFLVITFFSFVYFFDRTQNFNSSSLSDQLSYWKVSLKNAENFTIDKKDVEKVNDSEIDDLTSRNSEQILLIKRFTNIAEVQANGFIEDWQTQLTSMFEPARSPYFGVLTTKIECPEEFQPTYNESLNPNNKIIYYKLFATERFSFGVCSKDLIKYRAIVALSYCKNQKELYQLEYFIPNLEHNEQAEETIRSFSC